MHKHVTGNKKRIILEMENIIKESLIDSFIYGFGIGSEIPFIDFAKKTESETYRLWVDTDWNLNGISFDPNLTEEQTELLKLNELRNLNVFSVKLNKKNELTLGLEKNILITISGNPKDQSIFEPIRLYKTSPENKIIWISERK